MLGAAKGEAKGAIREVTQGRGAVSALSATQGKSVVVGQGTYGILRER